MTAELEINDYPPNVRGKMISKDFLNNIYDLTGCQVTVRGIYTDPNKKSIQGAKKLYLLVEGEDKYSVTTAYNELKSTLA
jgi:ATP-dependent RNA helicase DDX46/PRP5